MQLTRRLDKNHDMTFGQGLQNFTVNSESVAECVQIRLLTFQEEWFLDTSAGVPYLQEIATKPVDIPYAVALIKAEIAATDGVDELTAFNYQYDTATRKLSIQTTIRTIYGDTLNIQVVPAL